MTTAMQKQPVVTITTVTTAVSAIFAAAVEFGLPLSETQQDSILGLIAALYPIVTAAWTWHKVYAPANVVTATTGEKAHADVAGTEHR